MKTLLCFLFSAFCLVASAAVSFDATDDIVATANNNFCQSSNPITVSAWIKVTGFSEGSAGSRLGIICERRGPTPARGWLFYFGSHSTGSGTNTLILSVTHSVASVFKSSQPQFVLSNQWVHVAATWDGNISTNGILLYASGVAGGTPFTHGQGSGVYPEATNVQFTIGARYDTSVTFGGDIQEVAVWTNVLTSTEIQLLASARVARLPLMVRPASLIAYWPLGQTADGTALGAANCIVDMSRHGNHASPTNSPTARASSALSYP